MKSRTVTSGETRQRIPTSASPPRTEKVFFGLALSPRVLWSSLFLLTLLAYFPALKAGFIWDDDGHITRPELRSIDGLVRIWFELGATQQYYPVLHSAFWLEHQLWGDAPFGYHLINVLLHATAASLFGALLSRLKIPGAWFAAFLFALHPVAVESVAWISEQKNTLSTVFYLCAALAYLRFNEGRTTQRYVAATLFFVAALLSKTVTATLPAALLVILWWRDGSLSWRKHVLPLTPWLLMGIAAGFMTASFERSEIGAQGADFALTLTQRVLLAGRIAWFYFGKLAWPHPLIFIYPRWSIDAAAVWQYFFPVAAAAVFIGLAFRKNARGIFAAVLFFIGSLMPALGFFNVYPFIFSFVADHFQYLASLGLFALAGAAVSLLLDRWSGWSSRVVLASLLVAYGVLTWSQTKNYRAALTLYQSILDKNTTAWMAHQNLATSLVEAGRGTEAISHFEEALRLRPGYLEAENSFGDLLTRLGRLQDAMLHLDRAIALQPKFAEAHNNRGVALMSMGRAAEGTDEFKYALRLKPS
ncbi:MAG TPA: tetratricopeptide repeat protein, partial [Opitutaceae bacterium]|nr:tetratricopeptide repeat protein [Opitutaceae bacterium]